MRGLVYKGPRDVAVEEVPDARIEQPTDVLVRITSTNIRGSDLHMHEGRTDLDPGMVLGHENLGEEAARGERQGTCGAARPGGGNAGSRADTDRFRRHRVGRRWPSSNDQLNPLAGRRRSAAPPVTD